MGKLFKYLKQHAMVILAIIVVLFVQAFCDLSLPTYTSDIVNVGIQQGGIDTTVPEQIGKTDLENLLLLVPQEDAGTVQDAYREGTKEDLDTGEEFVVLKDAVRNDEEQMNELFDILGKPMFLAEGLSSDSEELDAMKEQIPFLKGLPFNPGDYNISRYINFAFLAVYNNNANAVDQFLNYVVDIDKELSRKREEYHLPFIDYYDRDTSETE